MHLTLDRVECSRRAARRYCLLRAHLSADISVDKRDGTTLLLRQKLVSGNADVGETKGIQNTDSKWNYLRPQSSRSFAFGAGGTSEFVLQLIGKSGQIAQVDFVDVDDLGNAKIS